MRFSRLPVQTLMKTRVPGKTEILNELPQVTESIGDLADLLNVVLAYVEDVLADRVTPDNTIGRHLLKLTQAVPKMSETELDSFLNANIKVGLIQRETFLKIFTLHYL